MQVGAGLATTAIVLYQASWGHCDSGSVASVPIMSKSIFLFSQKRKHNFLKCIFCFPTANPRIFSPKL